MCEWEQKLQNLIDKAHQYHEEGEARVAEFKEQLESFCGKQYSQDVIVPAFNKIKERFEVKGSYVWIQWEANRTWLTIGYGQEVDGKQKYTKEVRYQVEISVNTMKSRLYLPLSFGPIKEYPISDEREIAGNSIGKNISDVTIDDIVNDFIATYEMYLEK